MEESNRAVKPVGEEDKYARMEPLSLVDQSHQDSEEKSKGQEWNPSERRKKERIRKTERQLQHYYFQYTKSRMALWLEISGPKGYLLCGERGLTPLEIVSWNRMALLSPES